MKEYASVILFAFILMTYPINAQFKNPAFPTDSTESLDTDNELIEETLIEEIDSGEDESGLLDLLESLRKHPYDLNEVKSGQLENIPFINSVIAKKIIDYRNENVAFKTKRELLKLEGITPELYEKIKIYLKVSNKNIYFNSYKKQNNITGKSDIKNTKLTSRLRSRLLQDLIPKSGYLTKKYEGSRIKLYNQFNFRLSTLKYNLEANLTIEKDPGEKNLSDFVSGFAGLKNYGFIKNVVMGDYVLNFGQGLSMWSLQAFSKGADAINPVKKKGKGLKGYGSVNEVQFFRGGAFNINAFRNFELNIFYSDNYYDASSNILSGNVSSFYYDGYHRTSAEIERKNAVKEKLIGGRISFENGTYKFGATYWSSKFSRSVSEDSSLNLFRFSGNIAGIAGADYDIIVKNMNFFGEFALSHTNSLASVNGVQFTFYKIADLIFSYRNYPADFTPVHSFGFSESGNTYNERGFYAGILLRPLKGLIINSYFDQYKFPYRTFFNPVSTSGNDFLTSAEWKIAKGFLLNLKYKNENKEETQKTIDNSNREVKVIVNRNQINVRSGFIYQLNNEFRLRSRFEFVNVRYKNFSGNNKGYLFYSDIRIIPSKGLVFDTRIIFFNTDSYDSRIYEFENDIQGVMSNIPLSGKGRRWYVLLKYNTLPFLKFSVKYAETNFDGIRSIGSGNDEIEGEMNNRLSVGMEAGF